ncbi:hypothetical protein QBC39DRAFT_404570, partial [Podospora conica]
YFSDTPFPQHFSRSRNNNTCRLRTSLLKQQPQSLTTRQPFALLSLAVHTSCPQTKSSPIISHRAYSEKITTKNTKMTTDPVVHQAAADDCIDKIRKQITKRQRDVALLKKYNSAHYWELTVYEAGTVSRRPATDDDRLIMIVSLENEIFHLQAEVSTMEDENKILHQQDSSAALNEANKTAANEANKTAAHEEASPGQDDNSGVALGSMNRCTSCFHFTMAVLFIVLGAVVALALVLAAAPGVGEMAEGICQRVEVHGL